MKDQGQRCVNCRFYRDETQPEDAEHHGECTRFPRQWVTDPEGVECLFSLAWPDEVCGEWRPAQ